jgi:hypothetical protein
MTHVETVTTTTTDTPLITINQITLSGKQLWAIAVTIFGLLSTGFAGGVFFVPARASAVDELSSVVLTVQQQHAETRTQLAALTMQTSKLADAMEALQKGIKVQNTANARKRIVTPPKPAPATAQ